MAGANIFFRERFKKISISIIYFFFLLAYTIFVYQNGFIFFSIYSFIAESLVITAVYALVLYEVMHHPGANKFRLPELWICIGLLLYFACNLPYFSVFDFLNQHHPKVSKVLFRIITDVFANIRYLCMAIGFWLIKQNSVSSVPTQNE